MKAIVSNPLKLIKDALFHLTSPACSPVSQRIDSARMSHTRLKALQRPEPEQADRNRKLPQSSVRDESGLEETWNLNGGLEERSLAKQFSGQGKRMATRASDVSQFRLAAYIAQLPVQAPVEQTGDAGD